MTAHPVPSGNLVNNHQRRASLSGCVRLAAVRAHLAVLSSLGSSGVCHRVRAAIPSGKGLGIPWRKQEHWYAHIFVEVYAHKWSRNKCFIFVFLEASGVFCVES